ncbi:LysM peptidoglycan-binding domain-containing protein [Haliangium sp.]|uniref:LysM peptidoglycan-binding domain-containing protein n=1 Tax=Haliangium sp. TaxID=2663208 RepID=UPI003D11F7F0
MSVPKPVIGQKYEVQPDDTITEIAYQAYGDARRYLEIAEHNRDLPGFHPARLVPGTVIEIPQPDYVPMPRGIGGIRGTVGKIFKVERNAQPAPAGGQKE